MGSAFLLATKLFLKNYWPYVLAALVVVATHTVAYQAGKSSCDSAWTEAHNTVVTTLNKKIDALEKESVKLANANKVELVRTESKLAKTVERYVGSTDCAGEVLRLPQSFTMSWDEINDAANTGDEP